MKASGEVFVELLGVRYTPPFHYRTITSPDEISRPAYVEITDYHGRVVEQISPTLDEVIENNVLETLEAKAMIRVEELNRLAASASMDSVQTKDSNQQADEHGSRFVMSLTYIFLGTIWAFVGRIVIETPAILDNLVPNWTDFVPRILATYFGTIAGVSLIGAGFVSMALAFLLFRRRDDNRLPETIQEVLNPE